MEAIMRVSFSNELQMYIYKTFAKFLSYFDK